MLHLAVKAFYPGKPPFPLLHVDTTWKFRDMIAFRDDIARAARRSSCWSTSTQEGVAARHQPDRLRLVAAYPGDEDRGAEAGARQVRLRCGLRRRPPRRGEEPGQGAHLLASARRSHVWDPRNQRPELWSLFNTRIRQGEIDPRLPAVELDRARHLGIHPGRGHPGRAALFRQRSGRSCSAAAR